nr:unnamed protein product [Callosobruchus analis]
MATSDHTSQGTPPSTLSASPMVIAPINVSPPERFNFSTPAAWPAWRKRLERYMSVSGQLQKSEKEKIDILLYIMGEEAEEIILQLEKEPANFQEALTSLDKFFIPRRNIIYERYKFNLRVQKPGESVDAFITSLHSLAEHCNYGTLKEELIRERIVVGMSDTRTSERLQLNETLTLQQCVLEAKQAELQASHSKELNSHQQVSRVQEYRSNPASSAGDSKANRNPALRRGKLPSRCSFCGLQPHRREQCPANSVYVDNIVELESKYNTAHYDSSDCEGEEVSDKFLGPISVVYGVNHVSSKEWVVSVFVTKLEKSLDFLVDSGADISCIPKCFIDNKLKSKIKPSKNIVTGPSGVKLSLLGTLNVDLKYKNQTCNTEIYVIDNLTKPILGRTSILELNVLGSFLHQIARAESTDSASEKKQIISEFPKIFNDIGNFKTELKIKLVEGVQPYIQSVPRIVPIPLLKPLKQELDRLQKLDIIEAVDFPTEWVSPIVVVQKNGKVRLCVDYTRLNKAVLRAHYPIGKVEMILAKLSGSKYFTKLDTNSGFHQIKLSPDSQLLTTFITPYGRYFFKRLPFGINFNSSILLRNLRIVIPKSLQLQVLKFIHEGHFGIVKCRNRAKSSVWWIGLSTQIENLVRNCPQCVEHRTNPKEPMVIDDFPERPWQKAALDLYKC